MLRDGALDGCRACTAVGEAAGERLAQLGARVVPWPAPAGSAERAERPAAAPIGAPGP